MKTLKCSSSCAVLVATGLLFATLGNAADSRLPAKAEPQSQVSQSVQPEVDRKTAEAAQEKRRQLIAEAQTAIAETEKAQQALADKKAKAALDALAAATGKLELILARNPKLALAPVRTEVITHDLLAKTDTVKAAVMEARDFLNKGDIQKARPLISGLASEIELRTLNVPLDTYPAAIKAVTPLIDAGKLDEARSALQTLLNTLVVTSEVIPLPKLRAEEQIKAAQALAEKKNRTREENDKLTQYLDGARVQLQIGEALGYGERRDYRPMYAQIDDIARKSAGGRTGLGWFDKIRRQLADWT